VRLIACMLICAAGCSSYSKYQAGQAAEALALAGVAMTAAALTIADAEAAESVDAPREKPARLVHAVLRRECVGQRSFVLLCYDNHSCYFETNAGQRYDAAAGDDPIAPPELLKWCDRL
jgi:hypothetical protein